MNDILAQRHRYFPYGPANNAIYISLFPLQPQQNVLEYAAVLNAIAFSLLA